MSPGHHDAGTSAVAVHHASVVWTLRLAGLGAVVNGVGFGAFAIPATWHLAHEGAVWYSFGNPTYGHGPFEAHGISVTVPVVVAFFGACLVLALGGALLLVPRSLGLVLTPAGIVMCAPFWWGFDLPFAWLNAAHIVVFLVVAWALQMHGRPGRPYRRNETSLAAAPSHPRAQIPVVDDDSRALRRAAWAGAASVVALTAGVALCSLAGVDAPGVSDATIGDRLGSGAKQAAAGVGLPVLGLGVALLLWFATGLRRALGLVSGGDPLAEAVVPAAALFGGLTITGVSLDVSSAITALATDSYSPDPDTARVLGTAGLVVGLTGLTGGAVMVAATTRIAHTAQALPRWVVWVSYAVACLCLTSFWNGGAASVALALWVIGAVVGLRRASAVRNGPDPLAMDQPATRT